MGQPDPEKPPGVERPGLMRGLVVGFSKGLLKSAIFLAPGLVVLILGQRGWGTALLFLGSFAMMAMGFRRPWPLGWVGCLIPPAAALFCYVVQLWIFERSLPPLIALGGVAVLGVVLGLLRGFAHKIEFRNGVPYARKTFWFVILWVVSFGLTQLFGMMQRSLLLKGGLLTGAFSTSMLVGLSLVLLLRRFTSKPARPPQLPQGATGVLLACSLGLLAVGEARAAPSSNAPVQEIVDFLMDRSNAPIDASSIVQTPTKTSSSGASATQEYWAITGRQVIDTGPRLGNQTRSSQLIGGKVKVTLVRFPSGSASRIEGDAVVGLARQDMIAQKSSRLGGWVESPMATGRWSRSLGLGHHSGVWSYHTRMTTYSYGAHAKRAYIYTGRWAIKVEAPFYFRDASGLTAYNHVLVGGRKVYPRWTAKEADAMAEAVAKAMYRRLVSNGYVSPDIDDAAGTGLGWGIGGLLDSVSPQDIERIAADESKDRSEKAAALVIIALTGAGISMSVAQAVAQAVAEGIQQAAEEAAGHTVVLTGQAARDALKGGPGTKVPVPEDERWDLNAEVGGKPPVREGYIGSEGRVVKVGAVVEGEDGEIAVSAQVDTRPDAPPPVPPPELRDSYGKPLPQDGDQYWWYDRWVSREEAEGMIAQEAARREAENQPFLDRHDQRAEEDWQGLRTLNENERQAWAARQQAEREARNREMYDRLRAIGGWMHERTGEDNSTLGDRFWDGMVENWDGDNGGSQLPPLLADQETRDRYDELVERWRDGEVTDDDLRDTRILSDDVIGEGQDSAQRQGFREHVAGRNAHLAEVGTNIVAEGAKGTLIAATGGTASGAFLIGGAKSAAENWDKGPGGMVGHGLVGGAATVGGMGLDRMVGSSVPAQMGSGAVTNMLETAAHHAVDHGSLDGLNAETMAMAGVSGGLGGGLGATVPKDTMEIGLGHGFFDCDSGAGIRITSEMGPNIRVEPTEGLEGVGRVAPDAGDAGSVAGLRPDADGPAVRPAGEVEAPPTLPREAGAAGPRSEVDSPAPPRPAGEAPARPAEPPPLPPRSPEPEAPTPTRTPEAEAPSAPRTPEGEPPAPPRSPEGEAPRPPRSPEGEGAPPPRRPEGEAGPPPRRPEGEPSPPSRPPDAGGPSRPEAEGEPSSNWEEPPPRLEPEEAAPRTEEPDTVPVRGEPAPQPVNAEVADLRSRLGADAHGRVVDRNGNHLFTVEPDGTLRAPNGMEVVAPYTDGSGVPIGYELPDGRRIVFNDAGTPYESVVQSDRDLRAATGRTVRDPIPDLEPGRGFDAVHATRPAPDVPSAPRADPADLTPGVRSQWRAVQANANGEIPGAGGRTIGTIDSDGVMRTHNNEVIVGYGEARDGGLSWIKTADGKYYDGHGNLIPPRGGDAVPSMEGLAGGRADPGNVAGPAAGIEPGPLSPGAAPPGTVPEVDTGSGGLTSHPPSSVGDDELAALVRGVSQPDAGTAGGSGATVVRPEYPAGTPVGPGGIDPPSGLSPVEARLWRLQQASAEADAALARNPGDPFLRRIAEQRAADVSRLRGEVAAQGGEVDPGGGIGHSDAAATRVTNPPAAAGPTNVDGPRTPPPGEPTVAPETGVVNPRNGADPDELPPTGAG